jgi:MFS family permease
LALLGAAHSLNHSLFYIAPPLLTLIMGDLQESNLFPISTVAFTASLLYGVGALVGGPLGDRIGESRTVTIFLLFSGFSTFIMLAAGLTRSIYVYALALISMAAGASLYHPTANSLISKTFEGGVARAMGLHGMVGTLGVVLTPTIAWFLGMTFGWPWAFAFFGALCLLLVPPFVKSFRGSKGRDENGGTLLDALRIRELWWLLVLNVTIGLFMKGVEWLLPTYLVRNKSVDPMWASIAYTMVLAVGVPGQWIGGKAADNAGSKNVLVATMAGVSAGLLALLFAPVYAFGIAVFIILYGVCFYAHQPALNALTGFLSPKNQRGTVYGIFFFTAFGVGSLSQFISGYLADVYGLDAAFYLLTAFALTSLFLTFKLPEKRDSKGYS